VEVEEDMESVSGDGNGVGMRMVHSELEQEAASSQDIPALTSAAFTVSVPSDIDLNALNMLIPGEPLIRNTRQRHSSSFIQNPIGAYDIRRSHSPHS
jgi:hypothetical protein